jgi:type IV pilus assembly protein PilA
MPAEAQRSNRPLLIVIIVLLLVLICGGAVPVVGILAAIAIPNFIDMQFRAKRAEVPPNVDGIKTAEIAYEAAFDEYVAAGPSPVDAWQVGRDPRVWTSDEGFTALGWEPSGQVRGAYWVEVAPDGTDFTVYGVCDVDGDGDLATYMATRSMSASMQTGSYIY